MTIELPPTRRAADLKVGDALPVRSYPITITDMVAYAGATWDWHRMHYDHQWAATKGFPGPVVDGQVFGALMIEQLQDELGPLARVKQQSFRFQSMVIANDVVRLEAEVASIDGNLVHFAQSVHVEERNDRLAVSGTAIVELPA